MSNPNYSPPTREACGDGTVCPACLGTNIGYDVCSYLSGVSAPDGYCERLTEEALVCYDCGERAPLAKRVGVQYTPEKLMEAISQLKGAQLR